MSGSIPGGRNNIFAEAQQVLIQLLFGLDTHNHGALTGL